MRNLHHAAARLALTLSLTVGIYNAAALAAGPVNAVNKDGKSLALKGYDPVAYFKQGQPVKGSPEFSHQWMGATWNFVSGDSRDLFAGNPEAYAPQFGGYCSYAVSRNYTAEADPMAWKIVDGKLYLNYNKKVQKTWEADEKSNIEKGNNYWPGLHR